MNLLLKLAIGLAIAAAAAFSTAFIQSGSGPDLLLLCAFAIATLATVLVTSLPGGATASASGGTNLTSDGSSGEPREEGEVKWFNSTKGFGFITKDDGEEIFVHFRSIRGEGRRSLRDGQRVSFEVVNSDKGPQAEDVEPL
jgi:CspA family cold shock protein